MATKQVSNPFDATGLTNLAQVPPKLSSKSSLLASDISLPPHPYIACAVYTPQSPSDALYAIDSARRKLVLETETAQVTKSLLPSILITRDSLALYVFTIGSLDEPPQVQPRVNTLQLDGLALSSSLQFTPEGLYPCSSACSTQLEPCDTCIHVSTTKQWPSDSSTACLLPREPLRLPLVQFIHALRDRLVLDITKVSGSSTVDSNTRTAIKFKRGFVLCPPRASPGEWGTGWDHYAQQRPFIYCELQMHLGSSHILVHPVLHPTHYFPLPSRLSYPAGSPIVLLPHGVPAYYLNRYTGPVGSLTSQFMSVFEGLGVGDWKGLSIDDEDTCHRPGTATAMTPTYVIAWLPVQNDHGEDKGIPMIWPSGLCVTSTLPAATARAPLKHMPTLPAQLLASPPSLAVQAPPIRFPLSSLTPIVTSPQAMAPSPMTSSDEPPSERRESISDGQSLADSAIPMTRTEHSSIPMQLASSDSLLAFSSLTITGKDIKALAGEVRIYVDAVAKEREKERERLKREREGGTRSASGSFRHVEKVKSVSASPVKIAEEPVESPQQQTSPSSVIPNSSDSCGHGRFEQPTVGPVLSPSASSIPVATTDITPATTGLEILNNLPVEHPDMPMEDVVRTNIKEEDRTLEASTGAYDPFSGFESSWNHSTADFMGMTLDNYDIGMAFPMGMTLPTNTSNTADAFSMDDGFGVFTDDDFNFFDGPATAKAAAPVSVLTPTAGPAPLGLGSTFAHDVHASGSGPGPPSSIYSSQSAPWLSQTLTDGMTPLSINAPTPTFPPLPELIPTTPTKSPPSHSAPVTPSVMLSDQLQSTHIHGGSVSSTSSSIFDPIPFAQSHRAADGKYASGKFSLPTPPDERGPAVATSLRTKTSGWTLTYKHATDPRVGIVLRLAGAKRKRPGFDDAVREEKQSPSWMRHQDDWIVDAPSELPDAELDSDDCRSDSEHGDGDEEEPENDRSSPSSSRSQTPPPAYIPLGPTLLQTHFYHRYLLPLSVPLRSSELDAPASIGPVPPPMSAPTPVSPAAVLGAPSERTKSLEGAAQVLIKEVVENWIWAGCWRANLSAATGPPKNTVEVWPADMRSVKDLMDNLDCLRSPLEVQDIFAADSFTELDQPPITVMKSGSIAQVLPPALRFWEKLGLRPRSGAKNVTAYLFHEGSSDEREEDMTRWLDKVSDVYTSKNLGTHSRGKAAACTRDGLVPVEFDAVRKTLVSFVASLPELEAPIVCYIVTPARIMSLTSPLLRQVFSAVKKVKKTYPDAPVLVHLVPEALVYSVLHDPMACHAGLEAVVEAVYDRIMLPEHRAASRLLYPDDIKLRALFQEPAFTLARPIRRKAAFSLEAHPSSLGVLDRHYILHISYHVSDCRKWLFSASIDQRGEAHDLKAWLIPDDYSESFVVFSVWTFAVGIALKANVEWRIVIAKLGLLDIPELNAWKICLDTAMSENQNLPALHVTLLATCLDTPWNFLTPNKQSAKTPLSPPRTPKHTSGLHFTDSTATTYVVHSSGTGLFYLADDFDQATTFIPGTEDKPSEDELPIRALHTSTLIRVPSGTDFNHISMLHLYLMHSTRSPHSTASITDKVTLEEVIHNYNDLAVLSRLRWRLHADPILPFHLAALEVMASALVRGEPNNLD